MALDESYVAALAPLSRAFETYRRATGQDAVLVGGAAVMIYTDGQFFSGDFDVVAPRDQAFRDAMLAHGFLEEDRPGKLCVGYYHPDHPMFGWQQVSGPLFDGRSDTARNIQIVTRGGDSFVLPPIEDMIADRLGQHAVASPTDLSRLEQARMLFSLGPVLDLDYLRKRVEDEGGEPALLGL